MTWCPVAWLLGACRERVGGRKRHSRLLYLVHEPNREDCEAANREDHGDPDDGDEVGQGEHSRQVYSWPERLCK